MAISGRQSSLVQPFVNLVYTLTLFIYLSTCMTQRFVIHSCPTLSLLQLPKFVILRTWIVFVFVFLSLYSSHSTSDVPDHLSDDSKPQLLMADTCDHEWSPCWVSAVLPTSAVRHPPSSDSYPRTYCSNGHAI